MPMVADGKATRRSDGAAGCAEAESWHRRALEELDGGRPGDAEQAARRAVALAPARAELHAALGRALNNLERLDEAAAALRQAVRLAPQTGQWRRYLAHVERRQGALDAAAESFGTAAALDPHDAGAHRGLGETLYAQGRYRAAMTSLERALELDPGVPDVEHNLALACQAEGELERAVELWQSLLARAPERIDAQANLAAARRTQGDLEAAEAGFRRLLAVDPRHTAALTGLAGVLELTGRAAEGLALLVDVAGEPLPQADVMLCRAQLLHAGGQDAEARAALERLAARADLDRDQRMALEFSLGALCDARDEGEAAFEHYRRANALKRAAFDPDERRETVDRIIAAFGANTLDTLPRSHNQSELPVLIVGLPRSGTSLVEQMLASHPQIHGAGELRDIGRLAARLPGLTASRRPYPECVAEVQAGALDELAAAYTGRLAALGGAAARVTDKMWQNFENLGLVELLIPRARVVHCRRDPLDTGLSCYFQSFGAAGPPFSYDLAHIGAYLREYERLMQHWRGVSRLRLLELDYEALVEDPEGQARRLVAFVDLEWHPGVLEFHANPRVVRTASSAQVRRPIYRSAVGRHRRYHRQLAPLREALDDTGAARRNRQGERLGAAGRLAEAMQAFAEAARLNPGHAAARRNLGIGHAMLGRHDEAEAEFRAALAAAPEQSEAWHYLAGVHERRGEPERAIECLERVVALEPASAVARDNLGAARLNRGEPGRAEALFREALDLDPAYVPGWRNLARALLAGGRLAEAAEAAERATRLAPADAAAQALSGSIRHALGDDRRAAEDFGHALQLDPAQPAALAGRARLLEADGLVSEALSLLASQPPGAEVTLARARLLGRTGDHAGAVAALETLREAPCLAHGSGAQVEFALGHARAGLGDHERAFRHFCAGNELRRAGFDAATHARGVDALIASFSREALDRLPRSATVTEQPVFVVGMPRTGKSIVEQILASHPRVHGAGETRFLGEISFRLRQALGDHEPYPMCVARATQDTLTALAADYLASVAAPRDAVRVTDTLPTNFLHVGLVELLFPNARIVHCLRDPEDVAWACFTKDFIDPGFAFACALDDIRAFQADYTRLMAHWREVSRLPIVEARYESLVRDTAGESRRLVEALGLDWDERCLRYHEAGVPDLRSARSVSAPLDTREIGCHRPYAGWMR